MKVITFDKNSEDWLEWRKGKITGSKAGDVITKRGDGKKIGYYQLIADLVAEDDGIPDGIERGHALEQFAIELFSEHTGEKVETDCLVMVSDENPNIAVSPDGVIKVKGKYRKAVEVKCLSSARYIEAYLNREKGNRIPRDYWEQVLQYFIVNKDLQTLYFVCYDPRIKAKPIFWITVERGEVNDYLQAQYDEEVKILCEIEGIVAELTGF